MATPLEPAQSPGVSASGGMAADPAVLKPPSFIWLILPGAILLLGLLFLIFAFLCQARSEGQFTYATDDAYITMTVARNLAQNGTWGIEPGHFASLVSSPAWALLMALIFRVTGPVECVPLAMNAVCGCLLLVVVWAVFRNFGIRTPWLILGMALIIFLTPMIPVAFTGLEHLLQSAVDLAYVWAVGMVAGEDQPPPRRRKALFALLALSPVLTFVRYEGLFLLAVAACIFLVRGRWSVAVLTVALGSVPVVVSGLIFLHEGWFFFPSTLIQKGNYPRGATLLDSLTQMATGVFERLHNKSYQATGVHMAVLLGLILLACLFLKLPMLKSTLGVICTLFFGTAFLHLQFARLGWFYRYEAYLVCLGVVILILLAPSLPWRALVLTGSQPAWLRAAPVVLCLALLMMPLLDRGWMAYLETPVASRNIWEQQFQMARFLHTYYTGAAVAANDIGAINYFANIHCCDMLGLADPEVLRLEQAGAYDTAAIDKITKDRKIKIGLLYESWFFPWGGLPRNWVKVGDWTVFDSAVLGAPTVSFYAIAPDEVEPLTRNLREFASSLPRSVYFRDFR